MTFLPYFGLKIQIFFGLDNRWALLFKVLKQQLRVFKNPVLVRYFYTPQDILIPVCLAGKDLQKIEVVAVGVLTEN